MKSTASRAKIIPAPSAGLLDIPLEIPSNGMSVLTSRYLRRDSDGKICETAQQMFWRVASVISACDASTDDGVNESNRAYATALATEYYRMMTSLEFFPNSPTFTGAGTPLGQLAACFVLAIMDNMGQESGDGIFGTLKDAALIQQTGGGVGFSFSNLRPKGDLVRTSKGTASGPISFLKVYDAAFCAIAQGGTRRGANMAVLRVDHPDIEEFIACKATEGTLTNFNLSVGITDKFMEAVKRDGYFELVNPRTRKMSKAIKASELFGKIAECAHKNGEPGVLFLDTANESNPVPKIYTLEATNPCGEQFLGPNESCCLGSINLAKFVSGRRIDWKRLETAIHSAARFLDSVIGANAFVPAVPKLREAALRIRRIGLGIMGLADVAYAMRVRYGSEPCLDLFSQIMEFVRFHAMLSSSRLAGERGSFPELKNSIYGGSEWKTPTPLSAHKRDFGRPDIDWNVVRTEIREHGLRNGALLTIAPTGTIGTVAGCEGYGCEPVFALAYTRKVKEKSGDVVLTYFSPAFVAALEEARASGEQRKRILDEVLKTGSCQGIEVLPGWIRDTFVVSGDIPASDHILVQATLQRFVDNSISKTINFPATATVSDVRGAYLKAWEIGCKGLAIYVTGSRSDVILETKAVQESKQAAPSSASISPEEDATPRPEIKFAKKRPRPDFLRGATYRADTPLGDAFITVNGTEDGEPFEVFMNVGRGGSDVAAVSEAMGRLISLVLRIPSEVSPTLRLEEIVSQLEGIGGRKQRGFGAKRVTSLPDSVAKCLGDHAKRFCRGTAEVVPTCAEVAPGDHMKIGDLCPDCNNCTLIKVGGCHKCYVCGRNECQ